MKLTKRQKKILLVSVLLFFLAITVMMSTVLIVNKNKEKLSLQTPRKNNLPNDESSLTRTKTKIITSLEQKLSSDNIKEGDLLKKLKENNYLNAGETN